MQNLFYRFLFQIIIFALLKYIYYQYILIQLFYVRFYVLFYVTRIPTGACTRCHLFLENNVHLIELYDKLVKESSFSC